MTVGSELRLLIRAGYLDKISPSDIYPGSIVLVNPSDMVEILPMDVYYLAHPIAPDEHRTFDENMESVLKHLKLVHELGIHAHAPYYANLDCGMDDNDLKARADDLEANCTIINGYCGIVLCGHKMSSGMAMEYERLDPGKKVINFIGLSKDTIRELGVISLEKQ